MRLIDRYKGSLLGLAIGDALGAPVEFRSPGTFMPLTDMIGGGTHRLSPGCWTDDTSQALCLARSLIVCNGFNPRDQLQRYVRWWQDGYLSSNGRCFDIGVTTRDSLNHFLETGCVYCGSTGERTNGNGSLMRIAPIPLFYANKPAEAVSRAADSSRTTHAARDAVDACRYYSSLIVGALHGVSKEELLNGVYECEKGIWCQSPLSDKIREVASGSYKTKNPPEIKGSGYVVRSLEAALWAFYRSDNFHDGVMMVVNLGDDADTTGAIYGQLAGAYYGVEGIPQEWRDQLVKKGLIECMAEKLFNAAQPQN